MSLPLNERALACAKAFDFGEAPSALEFIEKGYSHDQKFLVQTTAGRFLLRVSPGGESSVREAEFRFIRELHRQGLRVAEPVRFEAAGEFCCGLYEYIEGESGEGAVPRLDPAAQHAAGLDSGRELRRIHLAIPPPEPIEEGPIRAAKFRAADAASRELGYAFEGQEQARDFAESNFRRLDHRPTTFRHGDFHPANLIFEGGQLKGVIDFNRCDFGDPYDDFYKLALFAAPLSPEFASGVVSGYFGGQVPEDFWPIYNVFVAAVLPADLWWCHRLFPADLPNAFARVRNITATHDFVDGGPPRWWQPTSC